MSDTAATKPSWVYNGIWGILTQVFVVPREPPELPTLDHERIVSRKPSPGFLRYMRFKFWVGLIGVVLFIFGSSLVLAGNDATWMWVITVIEMVFVVSGSLIAYLTIHLRYDTMWYVFSDRSMRLRRGIWLIHESTITFENIQNVKVTQGPLQRWFGIANVVVETAGGGGSQQEPTAGPGMHTGLIEGVAEAAEIRDSIMSRVQSTKSTGLGDESSEAPSRSHQWSAKHLAVLKEIRDLAKRAAVK